MKPNLNRAWHPLYEWHCTGIRRGSQAHRTASTGLPLSRCIINAYGTKSYNPRRVTANSTKIAYLSSCSGFTCDLRLIVPFLMLIQTGELVYHLERGNPRDLSSRHPPPHPTDYDGFRPTRRFVDPDPACRPAVCHSGRTFAGGADSAAQPVQLDGGFAFEWMPGWAGSCASTKTGALCVRPQPVNLAPARLVHALSRAGNGSPRLDLVRRERLPVHHLAMHPKHSRDRLCPDRHAHKPQSFEFLPRPARTQVFSIYSPEYFQRLCRREKRRKGGEERDYLLDPAPVHGYNNGRARF
jgi:hypothetical protein